jgi:hypothetical protein
MSMFLGSVEKQMSPKEDEESGKVEVRYKPDAPEKTKMVASTLEEVFNGPLFERMVRNAVEEMILEGKLTYDMEKDTIDIPEDIVKRWAAKMEREVWSKNKKDSSSTEK